MDDALDSSESRLPVSLGPRSYQIVVTARGPDRLGTFVREALDAGWAGRACRKALLVTDRHLVSFPWVEQCQTALSQVGIAGEVAVLEPGEATKSQESAGRLYDHLISMKADRHTAIVAVGGGVIGDLAGFVAATFARGLPLLMVPTTLLSQVDSSVGGKVGINHPRAKNIIGAFHQPAGVWIDVNTLSTLPPRELRCGLAEVVKYGVILDAAFFAELEENAGAILSGRLESLLKIVTHSCRLKADVVTRDEREETGLRAVLNFGHTIGHAIEAVAGYGGAFQHGEAVAAGMVAECRLAERVGLIGPELRHRLVRLLDRFGLPTTIRGLDPGRLLEAMQSDKKNQAGKIRFVLPTELGQVALTNLPSNEDVAETLRLCLD